MFSPYYAFARRRGGGDPRNHVAVNVALYGRSHARWAMTERARPALATTQETLTIGPSTTRWENDGLTLDLDEVAVPLPRRIRGRIRLMPRAMTARSFDLDPARRHRWWPIAPRARVEVALSRPDLTWQGDGYLDCNEGDEPLASGFSRWSWSRTHLSGAAAALLYEPVFKDGTEVPLALYVDRQGDIEPFKMPPRVALPGTLWGLGRETRADSADSAKVVSTLEDTPFYSRSMLSLDLIEPGRIAMHESLSLDRFDRRWVQSLLPFRMPRRGA